MAAMASMTMRSPAALNCGAIQRSYLGHISRMPNRHLQVKCMAETDPESKETSTITEISPPPTASTPTTSFTPPTTSFTPPIKKKASTKFGDVFAFSGPAPETINGRLAMVGFVSAIGVELASGEDLVSQLSSGGVSWFLLSAVLLSAASLIPMFKGVSAESKSQTIMSAGAEMWNGRLAMIGLVALAVTEFVKGGPL
ncbi:hypothetical protein KI387_004860, partial [Taxus chinensis]